MDTIELFQRLALALAIGLLIGLERGWQARQEQEGERAAGLRTHALLALLGGVCGVLASRLSDGAGVWLGLAFAVAGGTIILFRYRETGFDGTFGATTVVAAQLAFALGALAVLGDRSAATAAGVAVAGLLALKGSLHSWVQRLTWPELRSVLLLAAMSVILLPVLPNRTIDPMNAINPFAIWLLTVLIGVISFVGYVAIKLTGTRRGVALTGLAGGLASSTAATLALGKLARSHPEKAALMAGGAMLAGATMMVRVAVVAGVIAPALLTIVLLPLLAAALVTAIAAFVLLVRGKSNDSDNNDDTEIAVGNPLDLAAVLKFGVLLTVIGFAANVATKLAGSTGAYLLAALSGIAEVDAITLSMARLAGHGLDLGIAALAVLIAATANTVSKIVIGWVAGGAAFGKWMAFVAILAIGAGLAGYAVEPGPVEQFMQRLMDAAPKP
ncbi:MAG: MgtC/SapB family protein [Hyphomicrobiaceae bacterium]